MGTEDFTLGKHESSIRQLLQNDVDILSRLQNIETSLAEQRGIRKAAAFVWGSAGGIMGAIAMALFKVVSASLLGKQI